MIPENDPVSLCPILFFSHQLVKGALLAWKYPAKSVPRVALLSFVGMEFHRRRGRVVEVQVFRRSLLCGNIQHHKKSGQYLYIQVPKTWRSTDQMKIDSPLLMLKERDLLGGPIPQHLECKNLQTPFSIVCQFKLHSSLFVSFLATVQ